MIGAFCTVIFLQHLSRPLTELHLGSLQLTMKQKKKEGLGEMAVERNDKG